MPCPTAGGTISMWIFSEQDEKMGRVHPLNQSSTRQRVEIRETFTSSMIDVIVIDLGPCFK